QHSELLWLVFVAVIASLLFLRGRHLELTERAMQWPDAVGLGLFAASGTQIGLSASVPPVVAIMMGVITAVFGGVLRDIVCNDIPKVFSDHRPYALCAFLGGVILVIAHSSDLPQWVGLLAASIVAAATRILAMIFNWQIPAWRVDR
ncbi:MAG: trimeric intracellular cation channel family protein, partial [Betaproteobacteria bacterium]|nr:trimeric intracellular cation channel family protein [Betaproteobacteria bacterium]